MCVCVYIWTRLSIEHLMSLPGNVHSTERDVTNSYRPSIYQWWCNNKSMDCFLIDTFNWIRFEEKKTNLDIIYWHLFPRKFFFFSPYWIYANNKKKKKWFSGETEEEKKISIMSFFFLVFYSYLISGFYSNKKNN